MFQKFVFFMLIFFSCDFLLTMNFCSKSVYVRENFLDKIQSKFLDLKRQIDKEDISVQEAFYRQIIYAEEECSSGLFFNSTLSFAPLKKRGFHDQESLYGDFEFLLSNVEKSHYNFHNFSRYSSDKVCSLSIFSQFVKTLGPGLFLLDAVRIDKNLDSEFKYPKFLSYEFITINLMKLIFEEFDIFIDYVVEASRLKNSQQSLYVKKCCVKNKKGDVISSVLSKMPLTCFIHLKSHSLYSTKKSEYSASGAFLNFVKKIELNFLLGTCLSASSNGFFEKFLVYSFLIDLETKAYKVDLKLEKNFQNYSVLSFFNEKNLYNFEECLIDELSKNLFYHGCTSIQLKEEFLKFSALLQFYILKLDDLTAKTSSMLKDQSVNVEVIRSEKDTYESNLLVDNIRCLGSVWDSFEDNMLSSSHVDNLNPKFEVYSTGPVSTCYSIGRPKTVVLSEALNENEESQSNLDCEEEEHYLSFYFDRKEKRKKTYTNCNLNCCIM